MTSHGDPDSPSNLLDLAYLYAIDAIDNDERLATEHRLPHADTSTKQAFEQIVRDVHETMALVTTAEARRPRPQLRTSILSAINRQQTGQRESNHWVRRVALSVAAVFALLVGSGIAINLYAHRPVPDTIAGAVQTAADRRDITVELTGGGTMTVTYSPKLGQGVVALNGVAQAPDGRTYQLWLLKSGAHPAGLPKPGTPTTMTGLTAGSAVAITIEAAGGAPQPSMTPLAVATLAA
ncbi:anti-sigma factor domain-containing protein [Smaragdicoccus niigatensis]|uniref:anti-sigma factor n=1 Tax=Smaragdicoccus niigatensis TaxID=359359 RepID=UPI000367B10A|nr:anti-sigma factor [Smaragdicoccus niigatensis]